MQKRHRRNAGRDDPGPVRVPRTRGVDQPNSTNFRQRHDSPTSDLDERRRKGQPCGRRRAGRGYTDASWWETVPAASDAHRKDDLWSLRSISGVRVAFLINQHRRGRALPAAMRPNLLAPVHFPSQTRTDGFGGVHPAQIRIVICRQANGSSHNKSEGSEKRRSAETLGVRHGQGDGHSRHFLARFFGGALVLSGTAGASASGSAPVLCQPGRYTGTVSRRGAGSGPA